uniref:Sideroflexin-4 n=1 Tax=Strongyloides venezuelensis TaxID=75913 RepID=A0A0K0F3E4_STRVS
MFDPPKYWEESVKASEKKDSNIRTLIGDDLGSGRPKLWAKLSMLSPGEQSVYMSKLIQYWPVAMERRAFHWPHLSLALSSAVTTTLIATKINGDFFLFSNKASLMEVMNRAPKTPLYTGIYVSGLTTYLLNHVLVYKDLYQDIEVCPSCTLSKCIGSEVLAGVVIPMISVPLLAHYVMLNKKDVKVPQVKSIVDLIGLSLEGIKSCRRIIPLVVGIQIFSGIIGTFSILWGRNKIFSTIEMDEEYVNIAAKEADKVKPFKERLSDLLQKIPLVSSIMDLENQRTKVK